jgi:hypothetical protein
LPIQRVQTRRPSSIFRAPWPEVPKSCARPRAFRTNLASVAVVAGCHAFMAAPGRDGPEHDLKAQDPAILKTVKAV